MLACARRRRPRRRRSSTSCPAADWDEREAHDLLRPAASTATSRCARSSPTPRTRRRGRPRSTGDGVHQVAVGPIHAGVIESGHFRFHVVGERILRARPAAVLQAPRPRARGRGAQSPRGRSPTRSAPARRARSPTRVAYAQAVEAALGLWPDRDAAARRARCCSSSSASTTTSTTSARSAPASASRPARWRSPRSRSARSGSTQRSPGTASCSARSRSARGALALDQRAARRRPRRAARAARRRRGGVARAASSPARCRRASTASACSTRDGRRCASAPSGPAARAAGVRSDVRADSPRLCVRRLRARRARRRRPATSPRACRCAPPSSRRRATCSTSCSRGPLAPGRRRPAHGAAPLGVGRVESPRGATLCAVELDGGPRRAAAPAHRLLRQLARARARRRGQPAARLPADQQELRALLRLRGPLMFVLLRQLATRPPRRRACPRARRPRSLALRHVDAGSCNGCEHELGARRRARSTTCSASASTSSPRRATPTSCSSPARSPRAWPSRCAPPTTRCPSRGSSPRSAIARWAAASSATRPSSSGALEDVLPVDIRIPGCPPTPDAIAEHLLAGLDAL